MSQASRKLIERGVPAGVSIVLAALVGFLTNVLTANWNWPLSACLGATVMGAAGFEIWKSQRQRRDAEQDKKDAIKIATKYRHLYTRTFRDVLVPILTAIERVNNGNLRAAEREQSRGQASLAILAGLRDLFEVDRQIRVCMLKYVAGPPQMLTSINTPWGRDSDILIEYSEKTAEGDLLLEILREGQPHIEECIETANGRISNTFAGCGAVILAPVVAYGQVTGMLVVDTPPRISLERGDIAIVKLFAKLAGFVLADGRARTRQGRG